jgi:hypothetical protein
MFLLIAPAIMLAGCSGVSTDVRSSVEYKTISKAWNAVEAANQELTICGSASLFDSFMRAYLILDLNQSEEVVDTPEMKLAIAALYSDTCE